MGGHAIASWKDLGRFYWSRIEKLMPPFYIAWMGATCAQLWVNKTLSGAPVQSLLLTLLGMDGYGSARGWFPHNYYQVGEWYLGCALICYLLWPVVRYLWDRLPVWVFLRRCREVFPVPQSARRFLCCSIPYELTEHVRSDSSGDLRHGSLGSVFELTKSSIYSCHYKVLKSLNIFRVNCFRIDLDLSDLLLTAYSYFYNSATCSFGDLKFFELLLMRADML